MKYKVGDRVKIKSLDWYNENKTIHGDIWFDNVVFVGGQSLYCGCELTIRLVTDDSYYVIENDYYWTDEMIEGLAEPIDCKKCGLIYMSTRCLFMDDCPHNQPKNTVEIPKGWIYKDENGNVINAQKIVLEKKPSKTEDIIKWLRECDMTKYIGVLYSGMCTITFDTEGLITDFLKTVEDDE